MGKINEEILNKVIFLANERLKEESMLHVGSSKKVYSLSEMTPNPKWEKLNDALAKYMHGLTDDDIIMIETMMFIGRDGDEGSGKRGNVLFEEVKKYTKSVYKDKSGAIDYLTSKDDLGTYLSDALRNI